MHTATSIRRTFLEFFQKHAHEAVHSGSLVPHNDPTLLFTNAGMVPFKNYFTGAEKPPFPRATTSQKCVRAGGKHNDLDNVGYTARHHTFFEMLGNFSFGDYFKERAIELAWKLVTEEFGIPAEKLYVTVYHEDDEAYALWQKVAGVPEDKILRVPTSDNFWQMGDTGPCGPCSEIFYDHGADAADGTWALDDDNNDLFGDRFIEIWNLVFMQFEQHADGSRTPLPKPCIDTGMGLERMAAVLQGMHNNYDIDLFQNLIRAAVDITHVASDDEHRFSYRIIADHLRSTCFLIADGVMPSNEGRGYVLRRIMRRAMRHVHLLGYDQPLMHQLVPSLIEEMGDAFPELARAEALMRESLHTEEKRFRQTLARGLGLLEEEMQKLIKADLGTENVSQFPGDIAFKLYDTYGFPLDLTQDVLRGHRMTVDTDGFDACMKEQKDKARAAWSGSGSAATDAVWFDLHEQLGATEFMGYAAEEASGTIRAIVKDGEAVTEAHAGDTVAILTDQTPFYGESGGQMGDTGWMMSDHISITITDTQKPLPDLIVHYGTIDKGTVNTSEVVTLSVDGHRRGRLRANHSATHLLHTALRHALGEHVTQKGSLVAPDRLRFDISHNHALSTDEIQQVETEVNARIWRNVKVDTMLATPEEAMEKGALALFGEKYGDEVRVVSMGDSILPSPSGRGWREVSGEGEGAHYSTELCGGTHVERTGDIGLFKIVDQSAVSSGVRRIEALTGEDAFRWLSEQDARLKATADALKSPPAETAARAESLARERKELEKQVKELKNRLASGGGGGNAGAAKEEIGGISFIGKTMEDIAAGELKGMADALKKQLGSGVVALACHDTEKGKLSLVVGVTEDLTSRFNAVELVKAGAAVAGGKGGGGRPDMAQAGGPEGAKSAATLDAIRQQLSA